MSRIVNHLLAGALAVALAGASLAASAPEPELGLVRWGRSPDAALAESKHSGRPVFMLFDEVPGCATCRGFGQDVLSNPLLVEAIEHEFVPVFVANNRPGRDAEWLAHYEEPAWNNPVVRLLSGSGQDVLARRDGLYSAPEIATRMIDALRAAHRTVPNYLELAAQEARLAHRETAVFATACYWEGEAHFGGMPGVVAVQALDTGEGEAVRVTFDHTRLAHEALAAAAAKHGYTHEIGSGVSTRDAGGRDHLHALAGSPLRSLKLSPAQAMRVNAALARGDDPRVWLSPSQREQAGDMNAGMGSRPMAGSSCPAPGH